MIALELPVTDGVAESVAVTFCAPPVLNVTENVPTPFESVESFGRAAWASLLVKWTLPE
jgi:hypothetical protein